MIVQNVSADGATTDITFTCPGADLERARHVLMDAKEAVGFKSIETASDVVKVSCIGVGMRSHAGVAAAPSRRWPRRASTSAPSPPPRSSSRC